MASFEHHYCSPLLVRKDTTIPLGELDPPFYVVTWERFPPKPAGVTMDVESMLFIEDEDHATEDPTQEIPSNIPAEVDEALNNGDHLYPTPNGSREGSPEIPPLPSRDTSPDLPPARRNSPDPNVPQALSAVPQGVRVRNLKPIWYLIRLRNNWSFLFANRSPALALLNLFLSRGCAGEFSHGPLPDGDFRILKKRPSDGQIVYYAVRGFYRYGVFLDFRFGVEILSQGVGVHHAPASMMITTEKIKAKKMVSSRFFKGYPFPVPFIYAHSMDTPHTAASDVEASLPSQHGVPVDGDHPSDLTAEPSGSLLDTASAAGSGDIAPLNDEVERDGVPVDDPAAFIDEAAVIIEPSKDRDDDDDDDDDDGDDGEEEVVGKKKPGKKGDFKGKRLKYLKDAQAAYFEASANGKAGVSDWYTNSFFPAYFEEFHWAVPWNCDSVKDPSKLPHKDDDQLTQAQRDEKGTKTKALKKKIKTWFNTNRNTVRTNSGSNHAWNPWLKKLKEGCRVKPRKPQASQFYMHHPDFKGKVDAEYDKQWAMSKKDKQFRMSTRYNVAKELLSKEVDGVKARIDRELEESHARAMAEYQKGVWLFNTVEDREDALDSMTSVIQPLLDGIHQITGFHVGFFAAGSRRGSNGDNGKFDCLSLTSGTCATTKRELREVDPQAFTQLIRTFTKIVVSASKSSNSEGDNGRVQPNDSQRKASTPAPAPAPSTSSQYVLTPGPVRRSTANNQAPRTSPLPTAPAPAHSSLPSTHREGSTSAATSQEVIVQNAMDAVRKILEEGNHFNANEHLLRSIVGLKGQKKSARIAELLAMADYAFDRENNIAKNKYLFSQLGIDSDVGDLFGSRAVERLESPPRGDDDDFVASEFTERQASKTTASPRKTRSSTSGKPPSVRAGNKRSREGIDDSAPEDTTHPTARQTQAPLSTRSQGKPSSSRQKVFKLVGEQASRVVRNGMAVLALWEELEKGEGFEANGMVLSSVKRPKEVRLWIKSARPYHRLPSFNPVNYGKTWWLWWMANGG
ncbi:hypothetical protein ONZ45_g13659 [Pleurotus djamor]|nr:hypothetical protein ONZ45_g13659 [Pleurotus djamor]